MAEAPSSTGLLPSLPLPLSTITSSSTSTPASTPTPTSTSTTTSTELSTSTSLPSTTSTPTSTSSPTSTTTSSETEPTSTSPSTTTAPPPAQPTSSVVVVGGTSTVIKIIPGGPSASSSAVAANRSSGFFHNTGAVAGTFSAVGVVVLVLLVFLATGFIRRRRKRKYDEETDEVAAAAARAGANPDFTHDDYDYRSNNTGFGAYSDTTSHGTLGQPPLAPSDGGYGGGGGGAAAADPYAAAGIAGVGRALSHRSMGSGGHGNEHQNEPYNAFAVPHDAPPVPSKPETYEMMAADSSRLRYRKSTGPYQYDPIIGGYGAGDDPYAVARGTSQRKPTLGRGMSNGNGGLQQQQVPQGYNQPGQPFYPPSMIPQQAQQQQQLPPQTQSHLQPQAYNNVGNGHADDDADPYDGMQRAESSELPNPHSAGASKAQLVGGDVDDDRSRSEEHHHRLQHEDEASESEDDDEPERNPRVLRVANE